MHPHALVGSQYLAKRGIPRNRWEIYGMRQTQLLEKFCCISKIRGFVRMLTPANPIRPLLSSAGVYQQPTASSERSKQSYHLELEPYQGKVASSPLQTHLSPLGSLPGCTLDRMSCSSSEPLPSFYSMGLNSIYHIRHSHKAVSCDWSSALRKYYLGYRCSAILC